jgi:succinate dehydrogenase cytochrome b subunit
MSENKLPASSTAWDWLAAGRSGYERIAYIVHRITGLGLLLYLLMHVVITAFRARHIYLWEEPYVLEEEPFKIGEFLVFAAFAYHAFNGLRLLLVDFGAPVGRIPSQGSETKPRPVIRPAVALIMLAAVAFFLAGGYQLLTAAE